MVTSFSVPNQFAQAVGLQADGRIVVAGGGAGSFALARYKTDGTRDLNFGDYGLVVTNFRSP